MTIYAPVKPDLVLRMEQCGRQEVGSTLRLTGLVKLKNVVRIIEALDLQANPRDSKLGQITSDIIESLESTPEIFPLKSKGLLIAASQYVERDRGRFELSFVDHLVEGVLDGGHNLLAIGHFVMDRALTDPALKKELKKAKIWSEFKEFFTTHQDAVEEYLQDEANAETRTLIPVEVIVPKSDDPVDQDRFSTDLLEIQEARNNNAQLKQESKSNAAGLYDSLRAALPATLSSKIEWKSNDGGEIKAADVIALTWLAVSAAEISARDEEGKEISAPSATQTYSGKGECVRRFDRFMSSDDVTMEAANSPKRELKNPKVLAAFRVAADLPELHDLIYTKFPELYNQNDGKFGKITAVQKMNNAKGAKTAKFSGETVEYSYPEGFIAPLVCALRAIMVVGDDGLLAWATNPKEFLAKQLPNLVKEYVGIIKENGFDPQKVGKSAVAYTNTYNSARLAFLEMNAK